MNNLTVEHWVIVLGWLTLGGAERQALYLAKALKEEHGCRVTVVGLSNPGAVMEECSRIGIRCLYWPQEYHWPCNFPEPFHRQLSTALGLAKRLRSLRPTFVAPYCMPANLVCGLTWRLTGATACVWQQRDEGRMRRRDWIEAWALRLTPLFISNSEHAAAWLQDRLGVSPTRIRVIRNGVPEAEPGVIPDSWRAAQGIPRDRRLLTMLANLHRYKDHLTLLRAWQIIRRSPVSLNWLLVLAGHHEDNYQELKTFIAEHRLGDSVLLPGRIAEVPALLADTELLLFSSLTEGVPNVILEGMACGLPIVATDIPGIREALGSATPQQLAAPADPEDLARKVLGLMTDPDARALVARQNRERVTTLHSVAAMVRDTIGVFRAV